MQQFAWIFSIIIGALILFFAFFFITQYTTKIGSPKKQITLAKSINLLLEPFSAIGSLAEMRGEIIEFPKDIYVEFGCDKDYNEIKAKEIKHKYFDLTEKVYDKFIFAKKITTKSKTKFFAFSLPIKIPFYASTAIVIVVNDTCVGSLNEEYKENLEEIYNSLKDNVDVKINFTCYSENPYSDLDGFAVAYLFSDAQNFNCNLERILNRAINIAEIYKKKAELLQAKGCDMGNIIYALDVYINKTKKFIQNKNKNELLLAIQQLNEANDNLDFNCKLF